MNNVPSPRRWLLSGYRALLAGLTLSALLYQFSYSSQRVGFNPVNFWAYFTNLSNLLAAAVFIWGAIRPMAPASAARDFWRGGALLCMTLTGAVFSLLLSALEVRVLPGVNIVVHYVMPVGVLADWLLDPAQARQKLRAGLRWLAFPVAYGVVTLIRGHFVDWYPYPFLSPAKIGYGGVAVYAVCILAGLVVLIWGLVALSNLRRKARTASAG